ncbi:MULTISPECIES: hypothetical protein [unclassified Streptomyces]|uniref:hypothetical protein n=1 Tax=unclassified Streptomyces TaxID=2593676 RepID=UPI0006F79F35|nr:MULTISPECIES: hypothetical protein [unclassified Streptomyces]KQX46148.1 hypothetical protein ASD33_22660 [Streptomyces sp. Root1304]KRA80933.1 hypothetical protein ASE09_15760 [Streptomyces sp. Root66D1]
MRGYGGVLVGDLLLALLRGSAGPACLVVAYVAWAEGADPVWVLSAAAVGLVGTVMVPVSAVRAARKRFPRITAGDRAGGRSDPYGPDSFVVWAPRSGPGPVDARLVRADVLEASFVRYEPDTEATYTTYVGDNDPSEVKPTVGLRLRVHDTGQHGGAEFGVFEISEEVRVPPLCLSAVTAGRLAVLVADAPLAATDPPGRKAVPQISVLWPRSLLLAGTRTCRVIGLDGTMTDVSRWSRRQLEQMRVSWSVGGVEMDGDVIDLRLLPPDTAARYAAVAHGSGEERAPVTEPGEEDRRLVEFLPGPEGAFGAVGRRWSRRGGRLVRARFLKMCATTTFQAHGPCLDTVIRVGPADGVPSLDAERRVTVPMNYLALLHHTRDVVLRVSPNGRSYDVDWPRTNLLAGVTPAKVVTPDGRELTLPERAEVLWPLMNLLAAHAVSVPGAVLDLRRPRLRGVADAVMELVRATGADVDGVRLP